MGPDPIYLYQRRVFHLCMLTLLCGSRGGSTWVTMRQQKLIEVTFGAEWVLEGYITKAARDTLFERADSIIYLDYPPFVAAGRYIKRWWKHRKQPRPELEGSPEEFSLDALMRIWRKGEAISPRESLERLSDPQKIIILKSPKEAGQFLQEI